MENDLNNMVHSWAVRIWLVLVALQALVTLPASMSEETPPQALANVLGTYPLIWSTFAIVISAGAVASEAGVVADSVLSKAVTRYEYILAKMLSRVLTVLGVYLLVAVPSALLAHRYDNGELTRAGMIWGVALIGSIMMLLTSLSVTFSTIFNRTLVAMMAAWFLWYVAGGIFAVLELEYLSPLHIVENLPDILQGVYSTSDQWRTLAVFTMGSFVITGLAALHFGRKDL